MLQLIAPSIQAIAWQQLMVTYQLFYKYLTSPSFSLYLGFIQSQASSAKSLTEMKSQWLCFQSK